MPVFRRLLAVLAVVSALALTPTTAAAGDPTVGMVHCVIHGHAMTVPAASALTLRVGWSMATRGNLVDFVHAATVTFTINGQVVTPTQSDIAPVPGPDSGTGEDFWRVFWGFHTTAPAAGQSLIWTTTLTLSRPVTDHEGIEAGFQPVGTPGKIPAGVVFGPPLFSCTITGS